MFNFTTSRFNSADGFSTITLPYSSSFRRSLPTPPRRPPRAARPRPFHPTPASGTAHTTLCAKTNWKYLPAKYSRGIGFDLPKYMGRQRCIRSYRLVIKYPCHVTRARVRSANERQAIPRGKIGKEYGWVGQRWHSFFLTRSYVTLTV